MEARKKCPPFCDDSCSVKHHKLLRSVINLESEKRKRSFIKFQQIVEHFYKDNKPGQPIPDPNINYRHPLLHWVAVLGKPFAVKYLLDKGHSPVLKSTIRGENAMHRVVKCFYRTLLMENECQSGKSVVGVLRKLTNMLSDALFCVDDNGNTPLHICAVYITELKLISELASIHQLFRIMLQKVLEIEDQSSTISVINQQNKEGNTLLHILAGCGTCHSLSLVKELIQNHADCNVRNLQDETAFEIARQTSPAMDELFNTSKHSRNVEAEVWTELHDSSVEVQPCAGPSEEHQNASAIDSSLIFSNATGSSSNGSRKRKLKTKPLVMPTLVPPDIKEDIKVSSSFSIPLQSYTEGAKTKQDIQENDDAKPSKQGICQKNSHDLSQTIDQPDLAKLLKKVGKEKIILEDVQKSRVELIEKLEQSKQAIKNLTTRRNELRDNGKKVIEQMEIKQKQISKLRGILQEVCDTLSKQEGKIEQEISAQKELSNDIEVYDEILQCLGKDT